MIYDLAPIVVFGYNRPKHMQTMLMSLSENELSDLSDLFIYCDGPKPNATREDIEKINEVRSIARSVTGFKSVHLIEKELNEGLDPSEINAVTEVVNRYGKIIVIEDDCVLHKYFLRFMNDALNFYSDEMKVYQVSGFSDNYECLSKCYMGGVFASYRPESLGWGTWANRWSQNNWDERSYDIVLKPTKRKIKRFNRGGEDLYPMLMDKLYGRTDAWDIRWGNTMYEHDALCIRPCRSLLYNIGFDGTGVHCGVLSQENVMKRTAQLYTSDRYEFVFEKNIKVNKNIQKSIDKFWKIPRVPFKTLLKRRIKTILRKMKIRNKD